jgi:glycerate kinase
MKIVIAPDSFKDSLSAPAVCEAMARGVLKAAPGAEIVRLPVADGGEGTVRALTEATGGRIEALRVTGPLGDPVASEYGVLGDGKTAVVEMAAASGLEMVPAGKRNPLRTTSYGTGELILAAVNRGFRKIIIGIGGSATTDCGAGAAQALGVQFLDRKGDAIEDPMTGATMPKVFDVDASKIPREVLDSKILIACDVANTLLGEHGAVYTYSRQKGASESDLVLLEKGMAHLIGVIEKQTGRNVRDIPGTGAAGGIGASLIALFNAKLTSGIDLVLRTCRFEEKLAGADLVLTGEGKADSQTASGKAVLGVTRLASRHGVPVVVLAGRVEKGVDRLYSEGVTSVFSICPGPMPLSQALEEAEELIRDTAERVLRLFMLNCKSPA